MRIFRSRKSKNDRQLLSELSYAVIDLETSGYEAKATILSIGGVVIERGNIPVSRSIHYYLPQRETSSHSVPIHQILRTDSTNMPEDDMKEIFKQYCKGHVLVGHGLSFDIRLLRNWLREEGLTEEWKPITLDTAEIAQRLYQTDIDRTVGGQQFLNLDNLLKKHGIPIEGRHSALGDAYCTALLLLALLPRLYERGIHYLDQV